MLIFLPIGALNNADSGFFVWLAGLGSFVYFCSINMYAYTLWLFLWIFLFLSLFVQSSVYFQLCVHIEPSPRIHRRLCCQHFDALLFCARICFRFFLCTSSSSCRIPTWRIRGHAVVSALVLNLQVQGALINIKNLKLPYLTSRCCAGWSDGRILSASFFQIAQRSGSVFCVFKIPETSFFCDLV